MSTVPAGFTDTQVASGLTSPTALDVAPDGRVFAAQQNGIVRIIQNDQLLATNFLNISSAVDSSNERGMLGLTLDPNFANNNFVYVYYTAKTPTTHNRVSRFTANGNVVQANSEVVIADFPDIGSAIWHMGGAIHFGPDGKLYVGVGDHQNTSQPQSLNSVFGKILRINPDPNNLIPSDNPFYNSTSGINRAIWAYGLRNPFTFSFQPGTGRLFVNDVGNNSFEEVNNITRGSNYGWPTTEGTFNQSSFPNFTQPLYSYGRAIGQCVAGAAFYDPISAKFPQQYVGKFFFVDFSQGWMKTMDPATGVVSNFATGLSFPTDASVSDDGEIYFLQRGMNTGNPTAGSGSVHKLDYVLNVAPSFTEHPQNQAGAVGQQVTFSVSATGTSPLSYQWRRNGSDIQGATSSTYTRTILAGDNNSIYTCRVTNVVNTAISNGGTLTVLPGTAPTANIITPGAGFKWNAGTTISFSGSASDVDDGGALPASAFTWEVDYVTGLVSRPLLLATSGITSGTFDAPPNSPYSATDVYFRIRLTVEDSDGVRTTVTRDIQPNVSNVTLASNIPGLNVLLDGAPRVTPYSVNGVVNLERELEAPEFQILNNQAYQFVSWSDGGARSHQINWPGSNTTITAVYAPAQVTFVSNLAYSQTPTNAWGPPEKDRSNGEQGASDGKTITLNGVTYTKGLGIHAAADLRFSIAGGGYSNFLADIGIDDEAGSNGSVIFQVFFDSATTPAYASPVLTGTSNTVSINVPIPTGVSILRLVTTDGGNGNMWDHADWANARLASSVATPQVFDPPVSYPTGTNAHGVSTGDLNDDDILDLVVANAGSNTVTTLFGNGDGTFTTVQILTVGTTPKNAVLGDLNGDSFPDIATPNQTAGTISVLLNNGNGTFANAVSYTGTAGAHDLAFANLDNDNDLDIVQVGWGAAVVRVLFNNGSGVFSGGTNYNVGAAPHSVVARDFTGDGKPDIAVANHDSDNVSILINNGSGVFGAASNVTVGDGPHSIRAGLFNNDNIIDLVTANEFSNNVSVLLGNGNGTFAAAVNYATGLVPKGVAVGDVNNDSKIDLLTANTAGNYPNSNNPGGDQISVLLGNGNGTFGAATSYTTGRTPFSIALGDFDNDGDLDAASANWHTNNVTVLKNKTITTGGGTTYVSDLTPTFSQNAWGPFERDKSNGETATNDGKTITLNGVTYTKGIGIHAAADLRYNLVGGNYSEFRADIGIDDEAGSNGSVIFLVYVDDILRYTSPTMTGTSATIPIVVNVAGGNTLRLVVTDAGNGNAWDHADWADARLVQGSGVTSPNAPTGLTAAYNNQQINLNWTDASSNETGFRVERKATQDGNYTQIADLAAGTTSYADTNLVPGTTYYYHVYAYNSAGPSVASNEVNASAPSQPGSFVYVSDLNPTSATNAWGPYERDQSNGEQPAGDGNQISLGGVSYEKGIGVHAGADIRYNIAGQGYTEFRSDIGVDDEAGNNGSVIFQVYVDGVLMTNLPVMTGASATQSIVVAIPSNAQQLRLVVTDAGVNSNIWDHASWGNARLITGTPGATPATPTNLNAVYNGTKVDLTWTDASNNETGFRIERKTGAAGTWALLQNVGAGVTSFADNGPFTASTTYYYRVFAVNGGTDSAPSVEDNITTNAAQTWLSDLNWTSATNGWGAVEKDRSNGEMGATDGKTITLQGVTYAKGLGVHANSDITFNIGGQYTTFITDIGIDDEAGSNGSVTFQVYLDGVLSYDASGVMTGTSATKTINLNVTGKTTLRLVANASTNGNTWDHADWAGARLL